VRMGDGPRAGPANRPRASAAHPAINAGSVRSSRRAAQAEAGAAHVRRPSPVRTKKNAASIDKDNKCYCSTPTPSPIMHARPTAGAERAMHLSEPAAISSVSATRACGARRRRCVGHQPSLWFCNRSQQAGLVPACMHTSPQRRVCGASKQQPFST
jgi:hypothetical protein